MTNMTSDARYKALVGSFSTNSAVSVGLPGKKGFGSSALCANGKIFAMLTKDRLVVKLPQQRVNLLIAAGEGERFDPGHGRLMKEWLSLFPASEQDWSALANEALAYAISKHELQS